MEVTSKNDISLNCDTVIFVTTLSFIDKHTAGYNRIYSYAQALSCNSITVVLFSFKNRFDNISDIEPLKENIYLVNNKENLSSSFLQAFISLIRLRRIFKNRKTSYVFYPSSRFFADFIFLSVFKILSSNRIFCEVNELRQAYVKNRYEAKNPFLKSIGTIKNIIDLFFYKILERTYSYYNGIITISSNLYNYTSKYNTKIIKIPILVDVPRENNYTDLQIIENFNIGFFGTISFKKEGLSNVFLAIKNLLVNNYNTKLFLYGPITDLEKTALQHYVEQENLSGAIIYKGIFSHEMIIAEMRKMNLLILPRPLNTQTHFGFSTKLAEYLISGVPVLVTDVSDNKKYIKDRVNGYMVNEISAKGFERKIIAIIDNYEVEKYKISKEAFRTAKRHFDYRLYKDLLTEFLFKND